MSDARAYLQSQGIEEAIAEAVRKVIVERPDNAQARISHLLAEKEYPYDLGVWSKKITSTSKMAQVWFDRGLNWLYGFNHAEAISCFKKAIDADPGCAMAYWGVAFAHGPNYNQPWSDFDMDEKKEAIANAIENIAKARTLVGGVSQVEKLLIEALPARYAPDSSVEDYAPFLAAFADKMKDVYSAFPNDLDVCALYGESILNLTPWQLWDLETGAPKVGARTAEAQEVCEKAMSVEGGMTCPGVLHVYIHLMEMSPTPEKALRAGDALTHLVPDSGHLKHMATHIDVICGDYATCVERNHIANLKDRKYLNYSGHESFYSIYRMHNLHFKIYGAMFSGQFTAAIEAANAISKELPEDFMESMADFFETFHGMKQHVLVRFGKWTEIVSQKLPDRPELYAYTTCLIHYAKSIAFANLKDFDKARASAKDFATAVAKMPTSRMMFNNTCHSLCKVAEKMMTGEIEFLSGNKEAGFQLLREAIASEDSLPYDEPWGWMQPGRHALAGLLLKEGRIEESERLYREDLGLVKTLPRPLQHPKNVWALRGLHSCLLKRNESNEINHIKSLLSDALARAEVEVEVSCFCCM